MAPEPDDAYAGLVSVVIPALNEAESLPPLIDEITTALAQIEHEIVVVDDASSDGTDAVLAALARDNPRLRYIRQGQTLGKSAGLSSAVGAARGVIAVTLDGDGQNDPAFIPKMLELLADPLVGLVAGQRVGRKDSLSKRIGSRIANAVRGAMLGDNTRDTACGLKAFRRAAYLDLPYFDTMHRFLPALFIVDGWKVAHHQVVDRPRRFGSSKYGNLERLMIGIPDLFGVLWLRRRRRCNPVAYARTSQR